MTHRLESIAAQLAARVRDDDPDANRRWLLAITDEHDRWALLFILAAAVPVEKPWTELLRWTEPDSPQVIAERRRQLDVALNEAQPAGVSRSRLSAKSSHVRKTAAA